MLARPGRLLCRAGAAGLCRAAGASQPFAKKSVLQSSPHGRTGIFVTLVPPMLGEPVLGEPVLIGRAIKRGWGEPSNEVGRASTKPLGEPVLSRWASHSTTASTPASKLRLGATVPRHVPARHCASSARLVKCQLGTFSARSALHPLHGASSAPG